MYKLTDRRRNAVQPILDHYSTDLKETGRFDCHGFERELRDALKTGYREIKDIALQLYEAGGDLGAVAEYYMRHSAPPGMMVTEFKTILTLGRESVDS